MTLCMKDAIQPRDLFGIGYAVEICDACRKPIGDVLQIHLDSEERTFHAYHPECDPTPTLVPGEDEVWVQLNADQPRDSK